MIIMDSNQDFMYDVWCVYAVH